MTDREELIEKAAQALFDARFAEDRALGIEIPAWDDEPVGIREGWIGQAQAALAVFEAAQEPTTDEREALHREATSRAEAAYPALNDGDELLSYPRAALRQHKRGAYITGFTDGALRRPVQAQPTDERIDRAIAYIRASWLGAGEPTRNTPAGEIIAILRGDRGFDEPNPQAEPTDAQVEDGCVAFYEHASGLTSWARLVEFDAVLAERYRNGIRRALRAAAEAKGEGR